MAGRYTGYEVAFLQSNYRRMGAEWCAEKLMRTEGAVRRKANSIGLASPQRWTHEDIAAMEEMLADGWHDYRIANRLGRSVQSVRRKRKSMNAKVD